MTTYEAKCAVAVRELAVVLESATPLGRDISSCLARLHGPVCPNASAECGTIAGTCRKCDTPVCVLHLLWCGNCSAYFCIACAAGKNRMLRVRIDSNSPTMYWMCERHIVPCAPVCIPWLSDSYWNTCPSCQRGMCCAHGPGAPSYDWLGPGQPDVCHECVRRCVQCRCPLYRKWIDPTSLAYRASMCDSCYRMPDAPLLKRHRVE